MFLLAVVTGVATFTFVPSAFANDEKVTICWRGRTISVPLHTYEKTFAPRGATLGPCEVSPP